MKESERDPQRLANGKTFHDVRFTSGNSVTLCNAAGC
jgi:hypothetical protein